MDGRPRCGNCSRGCREGRVALYDVLAEINRIGRSWKALTAIVDAADDSYPPMDDC
jgi:hypothetical protein